MMEAFVGETIKMWGERATTAEAERDSLKKETDKLKEERATLRKKMEDLSRTVDRLTGDLEEARRRLENSEAEKETQQELVKDLLREMERLKNDCPPQGGSSNRVNQNASPTKEEVKDEEDIKPLIPQAPFGELAVEANVIPEHRRITLDLLPVIDLPLRDEGLGQPFSRYDIMSVLGGNSQQATNAEYFAFRHSSNPWLPKARIGHGYAFVGLPGAKLRDDLIGVDGPLMRPLFVGFQKPDDPTRTGWYYMGKYEFSVPSLYPQAKLEEDAAVSEADQQQGQQRFLSPVEWESLTENFRSEYTKMASPRYNISPSQLADDYAAGRKGCPFRLAKCVGFDNEMYQRLKSGDKSKRPPTAKQRAQESSSRASKRKREQDDSSPSGSSKRLQGASLEDVKKEEDTMDVEWS
ncbi:hypothetical protein M407DRAFT_23711 [Tulasnella calospora MUT 4182]|uniref:DUF6697 domain-containing protein n=1 Tax=Tulasnella calospora MUT 4182 TaxID=1051891 RepID=A0A0C3QA28_9AGAM|nr:hypothetical protein M407DRAFT_23711 [Tulasnella calospora MUT 4182]